MGLRSLKVNEAIKETLSTVLSTAGLKDPRVGFVTVTGVETSTDLRHARVFVSVLGSDDERQATMAALERSRGYLQSRLGESLRMKRTPQLEFVYDETLDRAMHLAELFEQEESLLGVEAPEIFVDGADDERGADTGDVDEGTSA
ncbi:MAG: 30S ribosome-binding factor RbfA [Thermoleophilia bacterium]